MVLYCIVNFISIMYKNSFIDNEFSDQKVKYYYHLDSSTISIPRLFHFSDFFDSPTVSSPGITNV